MATRIAAHTFIFQQYGFDQAKQADKIADAISEAGFGAVQWHPAAFTGDDYKNRLESAQRNSGLDLIGVSQSLPLWNQGEYERVMDILDDHAERMSSLETDLSCNITCSGKTLANRNPSQNEHLLQVLTEVGSLFDSLDLKFAYQNNGDQQADMDFLTDGLEEDLLRLSPDVLALHLAGIDPIAYISEHGERVNSLHIRDYTEEGARTVALGEGILPFEGLKAALSEIAFEGDIIVDLILPSGTPPDRPLADILETSRNVLADQLGV